MFFGVTRPGSTLEHEEAIKCESLASREPSGLRRRLGPNAQGLYALRNNISFLFQEQPTRDDPRAR
jgi:hypothetical protein